MKHAGLKWYAFKNLKTGRWTAFQDYRNISDLRSKLKKGYQLAGPFKSFDEAFIKINTRVDREKKRTAQVKTVAQ